ncbi:condensation domain-containing protein [Amycolatopsis sp. lyj-112]|uniref:condensation domain-containing protein n=1 Tax=Amycolatopsis sp. lyj-112 TaxID=2789288 RepID=UPI00397A792C
MSITETAAPAATDRAPLSLQQEFLCLFDKGNEVGPYGPRYHHVEAWRIRGRVDIDTLRAALHDVVVRHEALRTTVVRGTEDRYQVIQAATSPRLEVRELTGVDPDARELVFQDLLNELEADTFGSDESPLLRALLGRFDDDDAVLILDGHHAAVDSWSMQVVVRDLAAAYAARKGYPGHDLPEARQYREFVDEQLAGIGNERVQKAREYWRNKLSGARITTVTTDLPKSSGEWADTSWYRFVTDAELRAKTEELAVATRSSQFMILLGAFTVLLHKMTGENDIVVPTFMPGREKARFQDTVGSFFNFIPLRTDLSGAETFRDVIGRVRETCMEAYSRELPLLHLLQEAPELMATAMEDDRAPVVFQVVQPPLVLEAELVGDLEYTAIWRRELSQDVGCYVPDGMLWCLHLGPTEDILANLAFTKGLFRDSRMSEMAAEFFEVLRQVVTEPDAPLR